MCPRGPQGELVHTKGIDPELQAGGGDLLWHLGGNCDALQGCAGLLHRFGRGRKSSAIPDADITQVDKQRDPFGHSLRRSFIRFCPLIQGKQTIPAPPLQCQRQSRGKLGWGGFGLGQDQRGRFPQQTLFLHNPALGQYGRACDLGVAMQLTNIARDVGEDARAGRLFLPRDWLKDAGLDPVSTLQDPESTPQIRRMVTRLLAEADRLYPRSESGIAALPRQARKVADQARVDTAELGVSGDGCAVAVGAGGHHCAFSDRPVGRARLCPRSDLGQHCRRPELGDGAPEPRCRPAEHRRDLIPGPPQHAQPIVRTQFAQQAISVTLRL